MMTTQPTTWAQRPLTAAALADRRLRRSRTAAVGHGCGHQPAGSPAATAWHRNGGRRRRACAQAALHTDQLQDAAVYTEPRHFPSWLPPQISEIQEQAALDMAAAMRRQPVDVPAMNRSVDTAFVGPDSWPTEPADTAAPPFMMIPSFDSSLLEYRRLFPLLAAQRRAYAVDVVGWGFSDASFAANPAVELGPLQKREHLHAFFRQQVKEPAVVVGTSIGGATALDFALNHPEDVAALVLIDAQGFIDGIGPMSFLPRWAARLGVKVLKTEWLRQQANELAYVDPALANRDAMLVGRLNTHMPGWEDANVAFMASGGYTGIGAQVPNVKPPVLVLWGRQDRILPPETAQQFADALPEATVTFLEKSGHSGHLEEPQATADAIMQFLKTCRTTKH